LGNVFSISSPKGFVCSFDVDADVVVPTVCSSFVSDAKGFGSFVSDAKGFASLMSDAKGLASGSLANGLSLSCESKGLLGAKAEDPASKGFFLGSTSSSSSSSSKKGLFDNCS